jgi:hypothetical protein
MTAGSSAGSHLRHPDFEGHHQLGAPTAPDDLFPMEQALGDMAAPTTRAKQYKITKQLHRQIGAVPLYANKLVCTLQVVACCYGQGLFMDTLYLNQVHYTEMQTYIEGM